MTASPAAPCLLDTLPTPVLRELRSDHAGETGAVWLYRGVLAMSRDAGLRAFAVEHIAAEQRHLEFFERNLPRRWHSRLTPLWRVMGYVLGALPALFGPRAVYATVAAVETFVDAHYAEQLRMLHGEQRWRWLHDRLAEFRRDELHHRDEAAAAGALARRPVPRWSMLVWWGSAAGAAVAKRV